jgi:hypothetical protein
MDPLPPGTAPPTPPVVGGVVASDRYCIRCGYALAGLPPTGNCPECGTSIELSLRERTLAAAAREYVATLKTGLSLVLNGILLMIVLMMALIFSGIFAGAMGTPGIGGIAMVVRLLMLCVQGMILYGYWKYTEPDPGQASLEATNSARAIMRTTVAIQALLALVSAALSFVPPAVGAAPLVGLLNAGLMVVGLAVWAVQFFAAMRYTRWIATRIPDFYIIRRTKLYMWLLPVVCIVGALLMFLGPLVALVMYWNLLDRLRKQVKSIVATGQPAELKGRVG